MKTILLIAAGIIVATTWSSCKRANASATCIDLETGETITVVEDSSTGKLINAETGKPVNLVVNKSTKDTIYGPTGEVVNNKLSVTEEGKYVYYGKIKDGDYKMKRDDDEYKIKDGDYKEKYEDDEYKVKNGDYKRKVDDDGDVKIKSGDRTIKIDGETGERKVKD